MRESRTALIFFVLLALGLFVAVPAEDLPETAYDESEGVPYESTPLISEVMPLAAGLVTQAAPNALRLQLTNPPEATARRIDGADAHRFAEARVALALLCTLLC